MKLPGQLLWIAAALFTSALGQAQTTTAAKSGPAVIYPDSKLTPGATNPDITQANLATTVCSKKWTGINKYTHKTATGTDILRPPTSITDKIKVQSMKSYGFSNPANDYELDHFISLEIGGCPDCVENLWPEAYGDAGHPMTQPQRAKWERQHPGDTAILPGSSQKDLVEDHLKAEVCSGLIPLARAQKIITTDWYACYLNLTGSAKIDCK